MQKLTEILITLVGISVTTGLTLYQLRRTISLRRARLKHDLELLELAMRLKFPTGDLRERLEEELEHFITDEAAVNKWGQA